MSQINILSPHVADLIAAGEVVERPASVIKELVENAFDAGAQHVTVEIRDGGATLIEVTDDGCGMAPEDAGIAFLRHATSKLHDEHGLEAIRTMGFRGEALAAISAVSHIELLTRRPGDAEGTRMTLTAGDIDEMELTGCPSGTSIRVRDLFYNTPARLKFLKSDRSEASACGLAALRCALGRPEVSVRFLRDGKEEFFTPGDGNPASCVYALLGRELSQTLLPVGSQGDGLRLHGFVSSPSSGRGNRSAQYFFCNGRFIRSTLLQSALEQAYRNSLLTGRFPACVIWLEIAPGAVDVNVHPAKTEVKFSEERQVFSLLHQAVLGTLQSEDRTAAVIPAVGPQASVPVSTPSVQQRPPVSAPQPAPVPVLHEAPVQESLFSDTSDRGSGAASAAEPALSRDAVPAYAQWFPPVVPVSAASPVPSAEPSAESEQPDGSSAQAVAPSMQTVDPSIQMAGPPVMAGSSSVQTAGPSVQTVEDTSVPSYRILGEALKTYLIVELEDRLLLIDKHAAHERMNFDRMRKNTQPIPAQQLLTPQTMRLHGEDLCLLEEYGTLLSDFGFELEPFGEDAVILRAVPAGIDPEEGIPAIEEILERLRTGEIPSPAAARDEVLHTVACKAAIKAGWDTSPAELEAIAAEVLSGRVRYCPHGRPVSVTVTRRELDRLFLRVV